MQNSLEILNKLEELAKLFEAQTPPTQATLVCGRPLAVSSKELDLSDMVIGVKRSATTGQMIATVIKSRW